MTKRIITFAALLGLLTVTPSAFADSSSQGEQQTATKIDYSVSLLVDGKADLPATHYTIKKKGVPIYLHSTIGGNPATGEGDREFMLRLEPEVTSQGLELNGFWSAKVNGEEKLRREVFDVAENGKVKVYAFEMDGRQYEFVVRASY